MRRLLVPLLVALALGLGLGAGLRLARLPPQLPDPAAVAVRVREVARLETLEVALYKKVTFAPEPAEAESLWGDVSGWLRHSFRTPRGKAIVFADAHLGLDLAGLDASSVRVQGREVFLVLPPIRATVELRPGETEVIGSNLDSAETARLLELAKSAFEREVAGGPGAARPGPSLGRATDPGAAHHARVRRGALRRDVAGVAGDVASGAARSNPSSISRNVRRITFTSPVDRSRGRGLGRARRGAVLAPTARPQPLRTDPVVSTQPGCTECDKRARRYARR